MASPIDLAAHFDPDVLPLMPMILGQKKADNVALHDTATRRANVTRLFEMLGAQMPTPSGVATKVFETTLSDGHSLKMYWHHLETPATPAPGPAILWVHGGGYIGGTAEQTQKMDQLLVSRSQIPVLSVEYRLAPEFPHPYPVEDAYAALQWLHAEADKLGVDKTRIAAMGGSAGGGLAACLALVARDRGLNPPLKQQILIYPMLEDRNTKGFGDLDDALVWNTEDNITGWTALVGKDKIGTDAVSEYAAPPRAKSLKGLPRTYIDVGSMDLFVQEDLDYAARLVRDGVQTEVHVYHGQPHGFEGLGPQTKAAISAMDNRMRFLRLL